MLLLWLLLTGKYNNAHYKYQTAITSFTLGTQTILAAAIATPDAFLFGSYGCSHYFHCKKRAICEGLKTE